MKLSSHCTKTLSTLPIETQSLRSILEDPLCNSDYTEEEPNSNQFRCILTWRSPVFKAICRRIDSLTITRAQEQARRRFLSVQLMESCQQISIVVEKTPSVPSGLPLDCYDESYFGSLSVQARQELYTKPPMGLADILFKLT
jgi:hypothetical protein